MNILLVNPKTNGFTRSLTSPLGLLSIATVLKKNGHNVMIYDRTVSNVRADEVIRSFSPELIGVSLISMKSYRDAKLISEKMKKLNLPVVWGGPLASSVPELVFKTGCVDVLSIGEGEETWCEIAEHYEGKRELASVCGTAYEENGKLCFTPQREFVNLAELPPIDWSLIDVPKYFQHYYSCKKMLYLYSAKGCPGVCTFCFNSQFHRSCYRRRPVEHVIGEIEYLYDNFGLDGVYFADELWCRSREEMHEICSAMIASHAHIEWGCQTKIGLFNQDDFRYMYEAGCRWIFFGVESGSKEMLRKMQKGIAYDRIVSTFSDCAQVGIITIAAFIIGMPGETREQLRETAELAKRIEATQWSFNFYTPVPASQLYNELVSTEKIKPYESLAELARTKPTAEIVHGLCDIPERELKVIRAYFLWQSFTKKQLNSETESYAFTLKVIADAVKSLFGHGLIGFFVSALYASQEFLGVFVNYAFHPAIRRKYGLSKNRIK